MQGFLAALALLAAGVLTTSAAADDKKDKPDAKGGTHVFEMRTYHANPGKMNALHARFRDHTCKIFEKHGMKVVGFWVSIDPKEAEEKLVYILSFPSKEAADKCWKDFSADPEWQKARKESEKDGVLVKKVDRVWLKATDYSPLK